MLVLILSSLAGHAVAGGAWIADANGCKLWDPYPKDNETVTWSGACVHGLAEGAGTVQWLVSGELLSTFEGSYAGGKANGRATDTLAKGGSFEGNFVDGHREGKGVMVFADGTRYEGDFVDGRRSGKGVIAFKNGNGYEGDFVDDKLTGKGTYTWNGGTHYTGDMTNGRPNGKGILALASGDRYEGDFLDGKRTGKGVYVWVNGDRYEGDFVDGRQEGKGATIFANGNRYEGSYSNGLFSGEGKMQYPSGVRYEGAWKAGKYDGYGVLFLADGKREIGMFPDGVKITANGPLPDSPASFPIHNCAPSYSKEALDAKEEGTVRLKFDIGADGKLQSVAIVKSSGFSDLDSATVEALSRCTFRFAVKDGKPVAATLLTDYEWKAIPAKESPILKQLKDDEGLVLIDILIYLTDDVEHPPLRPGLGIKAYKVWLKNLDTHKVYGGVFNLTRNENGVGLVMVPEGQYCLESFATPIQDFEFCKGPPIVVKKGVINNAGQWWFAQERLFSSPGRKRFVMTGAQKYTDNIFQTAVNQHPELFEN